MSGLGLYVISEQSSPRRATAQGAGNSLILSLKPTNYNRAGETVRPATRKEMAAARDARHGKVGPA